MSFPPIPEMKKLKSEGPKKPIYYHPSQSLPRLPDGPGRSWLATWGTRRWRQRRCLTFSNSAPGLQSDSLGKGICNVAGMNELKAAPCLLLLLASRFLMSSLWGPGFINHTKWGKRCLNTGGERRDQASF